MDHIIEINHLSKSFGDVKAVRDISFHVEEGQLFAFLGVNGAGKSTTISILCGALQKDAGTVVVNGHDLDRGTDAIKRDLGVVFQASVLDKALSVRDNLESRAALYGITGRAFQTRLDELNKLLEISPLLKRPLGKLSGGQRRRIDIARALLHRPRILILDEPTTGLDPQTRKAVWEALSQLRREEKLTVFLTTHYMEEAADADFVVILDTGSIVAQGTPQNLKTTYTGDFITFYDLDKAQAESLGRPTEAVPGGWRVTVENAAQAAELIRQNPALFTDFEITKGKMDDVFLAVTGKRLTGGENA